MGGFKKVETVTIGEYLWCDIEYYLGRNITSCWMKLLKSMSALRKLELICYLESTKANRDKQKTTFIKPEIFRLQDKLQHITVFENDVNGIVLLNYSRDCYKEE